MSIERDKFVYHSNPNQWLEVSDELNESIQVITSQSKVIYLKNDTWDGIPSWKLMSSRSIFLLMGFAIENLIKGILIFDNPELVNRGKLDAEIKSHNLKLLILKIPNLNLDNKKDEFLETLSDSIP